MSLATNIKKQIVINLVALKNAGILASVIELDTGKDPLTIEAPTGYPFALVGMPSITSDYEDSATNRRTYRFDVLIIMSYEALSDTSEGVETVIDAILNRFDTHFTLDGFADASLLPAEIQAMPISTGDKAFVAVVATIRAQAVYQLGT